MTETFKQAGEKLMSANSVAIILPASASADATAAGLALSSYLKRLEKDVVVVSADGNLPQSVDFLPGYTEVLRDFSISKGFVINVSTKRTPIAELSYKKEDDALAIYLEAKTGEFTPEDVSFKSSKFPYEAVVLIGVAKYDALGAFYSKFTDLFFETPVINIDYRGANENYAQFNVVALNATSQAEVVYDLINEIEKDLIDQGIATSLLAGIISETNSFQHARTTPQVFLKASQLVGLGGNQQDIINRMFKNKSLGFLKLWGRVLALIKHEPEYFMVHSSVHAADISTAGASAGDVAAVIKEMCQQLGFAKVHAFFREVSSESTEAYICAPASLNLNRVLAKHDPKYAGPQTVKMVLPTGLVQAEEVVLALVRPEAAKLS